jgi:hypothetical protein
MEVIVLRGEIKQVRALADAILSLKGRQTRQTFRHLTGRCNRRTPNISILTKIKISQFLNPNPL